jgi:integrase
MLTVRQIAASKPRDRQYKLSDQHGLRLIITPTGAKLWRYKYVFAGAEKAMALGEYPFVSLDAARSAHLAARKIIKSGIDPMAERKAVVVAKKQESEAAKAAVVAAQRAAEDSFEHVATRWWTRWAVGKSPKGTRGKLSMLKRDVFPAIGYKAMSDITPADIRQMMLAVEKRASDVAVRVHEAVSQVFRYAIVHDLASHNPAAAFKPRDILTAVKTKNQPRVKLEEIPELLRAIDDYQGKPHTLLAMQLMAYTFVRTTVLVEAPWTEFDLDAAMWRIPGVRMKQTFGVQVDQPDHLVPLATQAVALLRTLKNLSRTEKYVFPGDRDKKKPMSNMAMLNALRSMGYKGQMTGHGFRGLASTVLYEHNFDAAHIEMQLAHAQKNAVSAAYNHAAYIAQRVDMMQWYADFLDAALAKGRAASLALPA